VEYSFISDSQRGIMGVADEFSQEFGCWIPGYAIDNLVMECLAGSSADPEAERVVECGANGNKE
jgi:hypothetical protein